MDVLEAQEGVGVLRRTRHFGGPVQAKDEEVEYEAIVLHNEAGVLDASDDAVQVGVVHVLVGDVDVVLGRHVVSDVLVEDQPQQPTEDVQINLLIHLFERRLQHHIALTIARHPHILQVVDSLAPLVGEVRGRLCVGRLNPGGEELPLVSLKPQVLVQVGVRDLLKRLNVVDRDEVGVQVHELNAHLLEVTLG